MFGKKALPTLRRTAVAALALLGTVNASATVLPAAPTGNNGGSDGWGLFFDLQALSPLVVTHLQTASTADANAAFSVEVFTRIGTALGGSSTSGPGSASAGWTSLGVIAATQGLVDDQASLPIDIPDFAIGAGNIVGVALQFSGAGPRYAGTGSPAYSIFQDANLKLTTGDARSAPFTTGGSFFSSRALVGSVSYETQVAEPLTLSLIGTGLIAAGFTRRRKPAARKTAQSTS